VRPSPSDFALEGEAQDVAILSEVDGLENSADPFVVVRAGIAGIFMPDHGGEQMVRRREAGVVVELNLESVIESPSSAKSR
jgi:hypothetical protein